MVIKLRTNVIIINVKINKVLFIIPITNVSRNRRVYQRLV